MPARERKEPRATSPIALRRSRRRVTRTIREELRAVIAKLKQLDCEDSVILTEFWHALESVNGENRRW